MTSTLSREEAFVRALTNLVERGDRGALAALRRGLGKPPGLVPEMDRYIVPWLRGDQPAPEDMAFYLVASLFAAWHQGDNAVDHFSGSLGRSLRIIIEEKPDQEAAVERRFMALLATHREELPTHLRHAVSLLRSRGVRVDWGRLLTDLFRWNHPDRIVQRRWARDFWRAGADDSATNPSEPVTETIQP